MAGVLGQLIGPQQKAMHRSDLKAMELQTAKEILAEVFRVRLSDVDEMIQNRFEAAENCCEVAGKNDMVSEENELWPQEFWLEG
jgi:hypothetical protein